MLPWAKKILSRLLFPDRGLLRAVLIGAKRDIDANLGIVAQSPITPEFCLQTIDEGRSGESKRMTVAGSPLRGPAGTGWESRCSRIEDLPACLGQTIDQVSVN